MPMIASWDEIALRLALSVATAGVIGANRGDRGHSAGMRTAIFVAVAAAASMIQANLLLDLHGRRPDSFVMLDLMRLPLGILSGMGFIGAGAIVRRGDMVTGVTTAATLWYVTVMGLCFGGGQLALGLAMFALAVLALWGLRWIEIRIGRESIGRLSLTVAADGPSDAAIQAALVADGFRILNFGVTLTPGKGLRKLDFRVRYRRQSVLAAPAAVEQLISLGGVGRLRWRP